MKKLVYLVATAMFVSCMNLSCSGGASEEQARQDSIRVADSIAQAEAEEAIQDSLLEIEIAEKYKAGIELIAGKVKEKWRDDYTWPDLTMPINLINNTGIDLEPEDYTITYTEEYEDQVDGFLEVLKRKRTMKGPELPAGESTESKIFCEVSAGIKNPKAKLKIKKEEFAERYRAEHGR